MKAVRAEAMSAPECATPLAPLLALFVVGASSPSKTRDRTGFDRGGVKWGTPLVASARASEGGGGDLRTPTFCRHVWCPMTTRTWPAVLPSALAETQLTHVVTRPAAPRQRGAHD